MAESPNRIAEVRGENGWSIRHLAKLTGINYSQLGKIEKGTENLSLEKMRRIARELGCSTADLLLPHDFEVATPSKSQPQPPPFRQFVPSTAYSSPLPIYVEGKGPEYCPRGCVWFDRTFLEDRKLDPVHCIVIDVYDDSMFPDVPAGSACLIDKQRAILKDNVIYGVREGNRPLIRRARRTGEGWTLVADNPSMPRPRKPPSSTIIGEVRWSARLYGTDMTVM